MSDIPIDQLEAELTKGLNTFKAFQNGLEIVQSIKAHRQTEADSIARLVDLADKVEQATEQYAGLINKVESAKQEANDIVSSAKANADEIISDASIQAKSILDGANARLQEMQTVRDQIADNADTLSIQVAATQQQLLAAQKQLSDTIATRDEIIAKYKTGLGI